MKNYPLFVRGKLVEVRSFGLQAELEFEAHFLNGNGSFLLRCSQQLVPGMKPKPDLLKMILF